MKAKSVHSDCDGFTLPLTCMFVSAARNHKNERAFPIWIIDCFFDNVCFEKN